MRNKVYIIDYDLISPLGCGIDDVLTALRNNICAEATIDKFSTDSLPMDIAAEIKYDVKNLYSTEAEEIKSLAFYDRKFELTIAIYHLMQGRLKSFFEMESPEKKGVVFGMGIDVLPVEIINKQLIAAKDTDNPILEGILKANSKNKNFQAIFNPYDAHAIYLAEKLQIGAFQKMVLTACAASAQAIAMGFEAIQNNTANLVLAGGSDSLINAMAYASFFKLGVLATASKDGKSCKPFDINRRGTLAGEAAGLCVLASEEFVSKNNIQPLFELSSCGNSLDAYRITSPDPSGKGMIRAMKQAMDNSGLKKTDIDYINLHGTGTRLNDPTELKALKAVFGDSLRNIPLSSTKDRHGHAIAAAGIQEFSILCKSLDSNFIPCNLHLEKAIDEANCDLVKGKNREKEMTVGMNCNYSFGGVNTVLIVKKLSKKK